MTTSSSSNDYAGDISPAEAWALLEKDRKARLVDVRTSAEWSYVGVPDLSGVGREAVLVEWQAFPTMRVNPAFVAEAERAAAIAMTAAGYSRAYNIAGGFEGDPDGEHHRGQKNGWKASGLPWKQT
jgi:rhodanese-related sulfurtransferase